VRLVHALPRRYRLAGLKFFNAPAPAMVAGRFATDARSLYNIEGIVFVRWAQQLADSVGDQAFPEDFKKHLVLQKKESQSAHEDTSS